MERAECEVFVGDVWRSDSGLLFTVTAVDECVSYRYGSIDMNPMPTEWFKMDYSLVSRGERK